MRVLAFAGTNSRQSINKALLNSTLSLAEDLEIEWADMNDYEMPLYSIERNEEGVPEAARGGISADSEHTDKRNKEGKLRGGEVYFCEKKRSDVVRKSYICLCYGWERGEDTSCAQRRSKHSEHIALKTNKHEHSFAL